MSRRLSLPALLVVAALTVVAFVAILLLRSSAFDGQLVVADERGELSAEPRDEAPPGLPGAEPIEPQPARAASHEQQADRVAIEPAPEPPPDPQPEATPGQGTSTGTPASDRFDWGPDPSEVGNGTPGVDCPVAEDGHIAWMDETYGCGAGEYVFEREARCAEWHDGHPSWEHAGGWSWRHRTSGEMAYCEV